MKKCNSIYLGFLIYLLIPQKMPAWSGNIHKLITQSAILNSVLSKHELLKKFNFEQGIYFEMLQNENESRSIIDWVKYGSVVEDSSLFNLPHRSDNHFHNPLLSWTEAGLDDWATIHLTGFSAILWSQRDHLQEGYPEGINTWDAVRADYYNGLTASDMVERQKYFAETFKGLGHQIHLLEDMSVPDHVRNDAHVLNAIWFLLLDKWPDLLTYRCIEGWAENNIDIVQTFVDPSQITILFPNINLNTEGPTPSLLPFSYLYDTDSYNIGGIPSAGLEIGLSEYTNANFVSEDTVLSSEDPDIPERHQFPYPKKSSTDLQTYINEGKAPEIYLAEDGKTDLVKYIAKTNDGDSCNHFLAVGYFGDIMATHPKLKRALYIDNLCHKDYASMLIPRAVGYSAALINYFFRGEIEVSLPGSDGIYSFCFVPAEGFKKISLMVKNITPNNEEMKNGQISLILSYRLGSGTPFVLNPPFPEEERIYKIIPYVNLDPKITKMDIPRDAPIRLDFDLATPLPTDAVDVTLTVVFKGDLGAELADAVAIGFKDISEPTPIDFFNHTDKVCFNGNYVNYDDPDLWDVVDVNPENGKIDCLNNAEINITRSRIGQRTKETYIYFSFNGQPANSTNYFFKYDDGWEILPGETPYRIFVLADAYPAELKYSILVHAESMDNLECIRGYANTVHSSIPYTNKLEWDNSADPKQYKHLHTPLNNTFGFLHGIFIYFENAKVPEASSCSASASAGSHSAAQSKRSASFDIPQINCIFPIKQLE